MNREHEWKLDRSWWGDPNVINGVQDYNLWHCATCGAESSERDETPCEPQDTETRRERAARKRRK